MLNEARLKELEYVQPNKLYTKEPMILSRQLSNGLVQITNLRSNGYSEISLELYRRDFEIYELNAEPIETNSQLL